GRRGNHREENLADLLPQVVLLRQGLADFLVELCKNRAEVSPVIPGVQVKGPVERLTESHLKFLRVDHGRCSQFSGLIVRRKRLSLEERFWVSQLLSLRYERIARSEPVWC